MDIMATSVDVSGAEYPKVYKEKGIIPMEGESLLPHFNGESNNRGQIFWEHEANIALREGNWKMVAKTPENGTFDTAKLELYNMFNDPTELNNLASAEPERLNRMYSDWKTWAEKVNVVMDTREYTHRARAYMRDVNGEFTDQFAGWEISKDENIFLSWDKTGKLSGNESAHIEFSDNGKIEFSWMFFAGKGEVFKTELDILATDNVNVGIEFKDKNLKTLESKVFNISGDKQQLTVYDLKSMTNGRHYAVISISANKGTKVWIDNVRIFE